MELAATQRSVRVPILAASSDATTEQRQEAIQHGRCWFLGQYPRENKVTIFAIAWFSASFICIMVGLGMCRSCILIEEPWLCPDPVPCPREASYVTGSGLVGIGLTFFGMFAKYAYKRCYP